MANLTEQDRLLFEGIKDGDTQEIEAALDTGADVNIFGGADPFGPRRVM